jgi:hypothetical protein
LAVTITSSSWELFGAGCACAGRIACAWQGSALHHIADAISADRRNGDA